MSGVPVFIRNIQKGDRISIGRGLAPALVTGNCIRVPIDGHWTYVVDYREDEGSGPARKVQSRDPLRRITRLSQGPFQ